MKEIHKILVLLFLISCNSNSKVEVTEYFPNGEPKSTKEYHGDIAEDYVLRSYYETGGLKFEGKVVKGKFVEYKRAYFENGNHEQIIEMTDSADLNYCCPSGFYRNYYRNGVLSESYHVNEGQLNGLATNYDSIGLIDTEYEMINDLKNGMAKVYYLNGQVYSLSSYLNDTLIESIYHFDKKGDSLSIYSTFNGFKDFPVKKWLKNGQLFYATFTDSTYKNAQYLWTDTLGNEIRKIRITEGQQSEFNSKDGWITPN